MTKLKDLALRLSRARVWVALQFGLTLVLFAVGVLWTRLPEKHWWQVGLTLVIPLLLGISLLELEAGTMRKLADHDGKRVKLVWGAMTLLVWLAVVWVSWWILDKCDDHIWEWAAYLNSKAPASWRAKTFTYEHIALWLRWTEWVFRWIAIPAKVTVWAGATAQWGWRVPVRRILRVLWNWQWWLVVSVLALIAVRWTGHWFEADPTGTVSAQEWKVGLKLAGVYVLGVSAWVLMLGWWAVLFDGQLEAPPSAHLVTYFQRLQIGRKWIAALLVLTLVSVTFDAVTATLPTSVSSSGWLILPFAIVMVVTALIFVALAIRSLARDGEKCVRFIWGALSLSLYGLAGLGIAFAAGLYNLSAPLQGVAWVVVPALLIPFAADAALSGLRQHWRRDFKIVLNFRWWLGVLATVILGVAIPSLLIAVTSVNGENPRLVKVLSDFLGAGAWVLLLVWWAVLFSMQRPGGGASEGDGDALVPVPVGSGPPDRELKAKAVPEE